MLYSILNWIIFSGGYIISIVPYIGIGFLLNKIYTMYNDYKLEKNPKKVIVKQIYTSLFDVIYKHFGDNINDLDKLLQSNSNNKLSLQDFDKLKKITYLTMDVAKENNKKYKIIINNNKLTVTLLDKTYINNNNLLELFSLLDLKVIKNIDDENVLTLEH